MWDSMPEALCSIGSIEEVGNPELFRAFLLRVMEEENAIELTFHGTPMVGEDRN